METHSIQDLRRHRFRLQGLDSGRSDGSFANGRRIEAYRWLIVPEQEGTDPIKYSAMSLAGGGLGLHWIAGGTGEHTAVHGRAAYPYMGRDTPKERARSMDLEGWTVPRNPQAGLDIPGDLSLLLAAA